VSNNCHIHATTTAPGPQPEFPSRTTAEVVCADITQDTVGVGAAMAWSLDCVGIVIIFPNVLAQVLHG